MVHAIFQSAMMKRGGVNEGRSPEGRTREKNAKTRRLRWIEEATRQKTGMMGGSPPAIGSRFLCDRSSCSFSRIAPGHVRTAVLCGTVLHCTVVWNARMLTFVKAATYLLSHSHPNAVNSALGPFAPLHRRQGRNADRIPSTLTSLKPSCGICARVCR